MSYTTTYPLEWLKLKKLSLPSDGENVEELELSHTTCRQAKQQKHKIV